MVASWSRFLVDDITLARSLPENFNLLRCVALTLRLARWHGSNRLRSVVEGKVWTQRQELPHLSRGFGSGPVLVHGFTERVFQSLCPEWAKADQKTSPLHHRRKGLELFSKQVCLCCISLSIKRKAPVQRLSSKLLQFPLQRLIRCLIGLCGTEKEFKDYKVASLITRSHITVSQRYETTLTNQLNTSTCCKPLRHNCCKCLYSNLTAFLFM